MFFASLRQQLHALSSFHTHTVMQLKTQQLLKLPHIQHSQVELTASPLSPLSPIEPLGPTGP